MDEIDEFNEEVERYNQGIDAENGYIIPEDGKLPKFDINEAVRGALYRRGFWDGTLFGIALGIVVTIIINWIF